MSAQINIHQDMSARDILQKVIRDNRRLSSKQNATLH
jgi:hypothetical protein